MTEEALEPVTGKDLISWGHAPGPNFADLLSRANAARAEGKGLVRIREMLAPDLPPPLPPRQALHAEGRCRST